MNAKVFLCHSEELAEGSYREFVVEQAGSPLYLVATRRNGNPRAWFNVCPHQGRNLNWAPNRFLQDDDGNLVCAHHGAVFEPDSGCCIAGPCRNAALKPVELSESGNCIVLERPE